MAKPKARIACRFKHEAAKLRSEAFCETFLKMTCRPDAWPQNYNTFSDFDVDASRVLRLQGQS